MSILKPSNLGTVMVRALFTSASKKLHRRRAGIVCEQAGVERDPGHAWCFNIALLSSRDNHQGQSKFLTGMQAWHSSHPHTKGPQAL
eukprot:1160038-Pelagomonas_calceolata.AAC.2